MCDFAKEKPIEPFEAKKFVEEIALPE